MSYLHVMRESVSAKFAHQAHLNLIWGLGEHVILPSRSSQSICRLAFTHCLVSLIIWKVQFCTWLFFVHRLLFPQPQLWWPEQGKPAKRTALRNTYSLQMFWVCSSNNFKCKHTTEMEHEVGFFKWRYPEGLWKFTASQSLQAIHRSSPVGYRLRACSPLNLGLIAPFSKG